ncbi:hypothetical protein TNCV_2649771 [Trichonephila clavipes]|nr:hypothetical protein TNCV_2649771 [Trichonephila clavipes]
MAQRKHLDDFLRGRIIGRLDCGRTRLEASGGTWNRPECHLQALATIQDDDVETNEQNLCNSIFKALTNLDEFQLTLNNSEASFSEGENVVSKRITLDRDFSSKGTDQHSPFQHPVSNASLPSVQGVKFAQILRPSDNANENFIMTISDGSPTFDIGPNVSQHNRAEVEKLLSTYTPKKRKL